VAYLVRPLFSFAGKERAHMRVVTFRGAAVKRQRKIGDDKISLAFTLSFRAPDRTLTGEEISAAREAAVANASKLYGATVRS
jgi:phenylalanyl-tRNA synthetase beta subunit